MLPSNSSERRHRTALRTVRSVVIGAVAVIGIAVTGCTPVDSGNSDGAGSGGGSAEAAAKVEAAEALQTWSEPGPAFKIDESVRGKAVHYVGSFNDIPFAQQMIAGLKSATELAGMELVVTDMQGSAATAAKLIEQGVAQHAAAIIVQGTRGRSVAAAVENATEAGIPIIEALQQDPGPLAQEEADLGVYGSVAACYGCQGEVLADYVAAESSDAVVAVINSPELEVANLELAGFKAELADMCPDCQVKVTDVPADRWTTGLGSATNAILANPDVDYIFPVFDAMVTNVLPAVRAAGAEDRVDIITSNASKAQLADLQAGGVVAAEVGFAGEWIGWAEVDMAIRAILGLPAPKDANVPVRLFTSENIDSVDLDGAPPTWFSEDDVAAKYAEFWDQAR